MTATKTKTKSDWKKARVHEDITLPSGAVVDIEVPGLAKLVESGQLPNKLVGVAAKLQGASKLTEEVLRDAWEFAVAIVPLMVAAPRVTEEDVNDLPYEDVEMLVSFALRNTDMDAVGKHLGGLHRVQSFRDIRGIFTSYEDVESDEGGGETSS